MRRTVELPAPETGRVARAEGFELEGFEARVGGGKLLVLAVDTKKKMDQRPATRQLLESIDRYVRSDRFAPEVTLDESFITSFMR